LDWVVEFRLLLISKKSSSYGSQKNLTSKKSQSLRIIVSHLIVLFSSSLSLEHYCLSVYTKHYSFNQRIEFFCYWYDIFNLINCDYFLVSSDFGCVWSWGKFEGGRLGYAFEEISTHITSEVLNSPIMECSKEIQYVPAKIERLANRFCIQIASQLDYSMALGSMRKSSVSIQSSFHYLFSLICLVCNPLFLDFIFQKNEYLEKNWKRFHKWTAALSPIFFKSYSLESNPKQIVHRMKQ
jgi:hypothetical protein